MSFLCIINQIVCLEIQQTSISEIKNLLSQKQILPDNENRNLKLFFIEQQDSRIYFTLHNVFQGVEIGRTALPRSTDQYANGRIVRTIINNPDNIPFIPIITEEDDIQIYKLNCLIGYNIQPFYFPGEDLSYDRSFTLLDSGGLHIKHFTTEMEEVSGFIKEKRYSYDVHCKELRKIKTKLYGFPIASMSLALLGHTLEKYQNNNIRNSKLFYGLSIILLLFAFKREEEEERLEECYLIKLWKKKRHLEEVGQLFNF